MPWCPPRRAARPRQRPLHAFGRSGDKQIAKSGVATRHMMTWKTANHSESSVPSWINNRPSRDQYAARAASIAQRRYSRRVSSGRGRFHIGPVAESMSARTDWPSHSPASWKRRSSCCRSCQSRPGSIRQFNCRLSPRSASGSGRVFQSGKCCASRTSMASS
jgi:hypothetical protein